MNLLDAAQARLTEQDATIARLEAEVSDLRLELGLVEDLESHAILRRRWGLTKFEGRLLLALYHSRRPHLTKSALLDHLYPNAADIPGFKNLDVLVCKVRRKIGSDSIETIWGNGYGLSLKGRAECDLLFGGAQ